MRPCPNCGMTEYRGPIITTSRRAEDLQYEELKKFWMGLFQEKAIYSYSRCTECGLLYAPVFFNEEQLQELYRNMPPNMEMVPRQALRRTQKGYFDYLNPYLGPLKGSYLEFGPDIGLFTENCVKLDCFDKYWLFEPNESVRPQLEALMGREGHPYQIYHELSDFSAIPDDSVAACVMIHVLDHLLYPKDIIIQLKRKLKKGGILLLVTHDERSPLARILGSKWPAYSFQHPQLYNLKSIHKTLSTLGFDVYKQIKTTNFFPISFLIKNLLWSLGLKFMYAPKFLNVVIGLRLGNILTLAIRK